MQLTSEANSAGTVAVVSFIAGVVLVAGGLALVFTAPSGTEHVAFAPGFAGVAAGRTVLVANRNVRTVHTDGRGSFEVDFSMVASASSNAGMTAGPPSIALHIGAAAGGAAPETYAAALPQL